MKRNISSLLLLFGAVTILATAAPGCKPKPKDADIRTAIEATLKANPATSGLMVDVKEGVATISGEVQDATAQAAAATATTAVKGVKSVQNNVTIAAPLPVIEVTADDPLTAAVRDATKDFPGVTASVKDGIISVVGELKAENWKRLKMILDGLRPKKVDAAGLKIVK